MYDPSKSVWYNPAIEYMFNTEINEWDIRDAGFSIIKQFKLLPDNEIERLELMGKGLDRHKAIGCIERDNKDFAKELSRKFGEVRKIFIEYNHINPDDDIISVKKDAIFMIGNPKRSKFGLVEFRPKNTYSSYLRFSNINNLEIYYRGVEMDIKGMSDVSVRVHRLYMYEFLRCIIGMLETKNPSIRRYIMNFIMDYKAFNLEEQFYIEFNSLSRERNPLFNFQKVIVPLIDLINKEVQ